MKLYSLLCILILTSKAFAWDFGALGGISSEYSQLSEKIISENKSDVFKNAKFDSEKIKFVCIADKKEPNYIGIAQHIVIEAPVEQVSKILQNFKNYQFWFDSLVKSDFEKVGNDLFEITTEQEVPVMFVANIVTTMIYKIQNIQNQVLFRYQLKKSTNLKKYDGFILLSEGPNKTTLLTEYDFFLADWGVAKMLGSQKIWKDSLKGVFQTDMAVKMRAESAQFSDKEVLKQSIKLSEKQDFTPCIENKLPYSELNN